MVQEDIAISPRRLYESYFLLLIWVVNFSNCKKNNHKQDTVNYEFEDKAHKEGYSVYHSDITATKKKR